jgi:hypothetical protein
MPFDYKKEYKEFYLPPLVQTIVDVPEMQYVAVRGEGNPNEEGGAYQSAMSLLYGISFTLKMSWKGERKIAGYLPYVVPPLEGFWYQKGVDGVDYTHKDAFCWISVIRLPDFVSKDDYDWAVGEVERKKKISCDKAEYLSVHEGLCVQIMHVGPFDDEPRSVALMDSYLSTHGYVDDFSSGRLHHEIYLSDSRKTEPAKLKTVIRHPIRKEE